MQYQWPWRVLQLGVLVFALGCVTETQRMPHRSYYDPYHDESVLDELKREFGWRKNKYGELEAPYTRAARSVKEAASEWFADEERAPEAPDDWRDTLNQLNQEQADTIRRPREREEQDHIDER
jgi:hypothetical protein